MALTYTLDLSGFVNLFDQYGRHEQFTRCAREALYEYYDELSNDAGDGDVDVVAICCDWAEYDNSELLREYSSYLPDLFETYESEEDAVSALIEALQDETTVIEIDNGATLILSF